MTLLPGLQARLSPTAQPHPQPRPETNIVMSHLIREPQAGAFTRVPRSTAQPKYNKDSKNYL